MDCEDSNKRCYIIIGIILSITFILDILGIIAVYMSIYEFYIPALMVIIFVCFLCCAIAISWDIDESIIFVLPLVPRQILLIVFTFVTNFNPLFLFIMLASSIGFSIMLYKIVKVLYLTYKHC